MDDPTRWKLDLTFQEQPRASYLLHHLYIVTDSDPLGSGELGVACVHRQNSGCPTADVNGENNLADHDLVGTPGSSFVNGRDGANTNTDCVLQVRSRAKQEG